MLWYMVYTVLLSVPDHVHDRHCCSNHFSVLFLVFWVISLGLVFVFPMLCGWWPFDEIWNIYNLIAWSSLDAFQFGILSTCEDIILMNRCEPSTVAHTASMFFFLFLGPLFSVFSFLLWNSLWLVEEVSTSLHLFLIMRMEISQFFWVICLSF
jgi:hypothetical protein